MAEQTTQLQYNFFTSQWEYVSLNHPQHGRLR